MSELDPVLLEVLACPCEHHAPVRVLGDPRRVDRVHALPHDVPDPRRHPGDAPRRRDARTPGHRRPAGGVSVRYADDRVLDDLDALARLDPGDMLRATADAGAQVRRALTATPDRRCWPRSPTTAARAPCW